MTSPKKRGEGTSCHHCKKRIRPNEMLKCTRGEIVPTNSRKRKRPCVKKYCLHCIKTFYSTQYLDDNNSGSFICPACRDECRCAACRRRVMKARLKNDGSSIKNEAGNQIHSILESQTPDATNIEEGQVNGLLEILDSRPDVQDIIRRGMAMDFADDNAKILYVGHLIDQALTRPDVLALYYASSHGRNNNVRIKTELQNKCNNNNNNNNNHKNGCSKTSNEDHHHHHRHENEECCGHHNDRNSEIENDDDIKTHNNEHHHHHNHSSHHKNGKKRSGKKRHKKKQKHSNNDDDNQIEVKRERQSITEVVPQPATISLSNMNGTGNMSFVNNANVNTFPPAMNNGMPLINFGGSLPPIHLPFPLAATTTHGITSKIPPHSIPLTMSSVSSSNTNNNFRNGDDRSDEQSASSFIDTDNQIQNGQFPMNVTPSVSMMGGPPLASM